MLIAKSSEPLRKRPVAPARANDLDRDPRRVLVTPHFDEALEGSPELRRALGAVLGFEPPLDELLRDRSPEPVTPFKSSSAAIL